MRITSCRGKKLFSSEILALHKKYNIDFETAYNFSENWKQELSEQIERLEKKKVLRNYNYGEPNKHSVLE